MTASGYRARRREQRQPHRLLWMVLGAQAAWTSAA
jgi:hypothetical protein